LIKEQIQSPEGLISVKERSIMGSTWIVLLCFAWVFAMASAERSIMRMEVAAVNVTGEPAENFLMRAVNFLWKSDESGYRHVWPVSFPFLVEFLVSYFMKAKTEKKKTGNFSRFILDGEKDNFI